MIPFVISAILIVHGLIVSAQSLGSLNPGPGAANPSWLGWWPTGLGQSWLLPMLGLERVPFMWLGGLLWLAGGVLLIAAGLGAAGYVIPQGAWRMLALAGALVSLFMLLVYLHPFLGIGLLLDAAIIVALVWAHWPAESVLG